MQTSLNYFSGFALENEKELFDEYIPANTLCVAGFSLGAIDALEYTLQTTNRIDRLVLLSPAFFNHEKDGFRRAQLRYFKNNEENYTEQFYKNTIYPSNIDISKYHKRGKLNNLDRLLHYKWDLQKLDVILSRGTIIEVFVGVKDQIVQSNDSISFFINAGAIVYSIKNAGHILQCQRD